MASDDAPAPFSAATRESFTSAFAAPTEAQRGACQAVATGRHALVVTRWWSRAGGHALVVTRWWSRAGGHALVVTRRRAGRGRPADHVPGRAIGESRIAFGAPPVVAHGHHGSLSREQSIR
ncbi:hypothetical protein [Streptomyces sp. NPDC005784]|uniref:hypothetical protein n=1 Tax=Streptomyces sp. NPDC005784 TaxID=3364731 RepID=UPI0036AB5282